MKNNNYTMKKRWCLFPNVGHDELWINVSSWLVHAFDLVPNVITTILCDLGNVIWPRDQLVEFILIMSLWSHFNFYFIFVKEGKECASRLCIHLLIGIGEVFIVNTTPKPKVHHQLCSLITIWMFYCYNA